MENENRIQLKDRLREAMDVRNMRAVELVEKTGIPKGAISYYLSGKSQPKSDRIYIIAKALDVSEAWLLGFDVPMERTEQQKENDLLAQLIFKLRRDPALYETVLTLAALPEDQLAAVRQMLSAFVQQSR